MTLLMSGACNYHCTGRFVRASPAHLFLNFCSSEISKSQETVAMVTEMIHTASLVHDDVIDMASIRRGKPSVSEIWSHKKVNLFNCCV